MRRLLRTGRQTTWGLSRFSRSENGSVPFWNTLFPGSAREQTAREALPRTGTQNLPHIPFPGGAWERGGGNREVVLRLPLTKPRVLAAALVVLFACSLAGCGESESQVDPKPFESAIAKYLEQNNMAMKVKQIKEGPTVAGETATLVASLTHAELGGPAVTWEFTFQKNADGSWKAASHKKR